ncbi:MAG TPA: ABC transporter permease [Iamia sp.]|nr:ABC transporter permease [Iamia sp.]
MIRFIIRRLLFGVLIMLAVTITVFFVTRVLTDPVKVMLPVGSSQEAYDQLEASLGLDAPLGEQFVTFIGDIVRLDFGDSYWQRLPALDLVLERIPATFQLVGAGTVLAIVLFVPLGIIASLKPGGILDRILVTISLFGVSMPQFWLGAMLIFIFSVSLGWLPTSGSGTGQHLVLPSITLALASGGRVAQITRSSMIDQLNRPYVTTLKAKGMPSRRILTHHVLRNALVPIVTLAAYEIAYALAGYAVIVETVFAWPGIGRLAIQAVTQRDIILLQAVVFVVASLVVAVNIIADVLYKAVDPRVKLT